ncbi:hypothetical protein KQH49_02580 [Mycetohabitans sp. B5]|uniref:hypothetical protein n=1 Tax=Mycetohabitans sp. B5 TaxID=2841846 RepID=UPI001F39C1B5|nr:hypothetical protein [Mycetohabitans sp. B5]MCG1053909.1 hypothetical protein [Mycetohabitans sp. B5]
MLKYNQQSSSVSDSSTLETDDAVPLANLYRHRLTAPSARHGTGLLAQLREDQRTVKPRQSPAQFIEEQFAHGNVRTSNVIRYIRNTYSQWNTQYANANLAKEPQSAEEAADRYFHQVEPMLNVRWEDVRDFFSATYPSRNDQTPEPMKSSQQDVPVSGNATPVMRHRTIERSQSMSKVSERTPVLPEATPMPPLPERQRPSLLKRWFSSVSLSKRHRRRNNVSAS